MDNLTEAQAALWKEALTGSRGVEEVWSFHLQPQTAAGGLGETNVTRSGAGLGERGEKGVRDSSKCALSNSHAGRRSISARAEYTGHYGKAPPHRERLSFVFGKIPCYYSMLLLQGDWTRPPHSISENADLALQHKVPPNVEFMCNNVLEVNSISLESSLLSLKGSTLTPPQQTLQKNSERSERAFQNKSPPNECVMSLNSHKY